jgi:hypothetical protein
MTKATEIRDPADLSHADLRPEWAVRLGGAWKDADVPWQGWRCEDIVPATKDADGRLTETCEMCRQKKCILDRLEPRPARAAASPEPRVYAPPSRGRYRGRG